jgi:hypothetical protein
MLHCSWKPIENTHENDKNTATQQGAPSKQPPNPDLAINEVVVKESPRDVSIAAMSERMEAARVQEVQESIEADPGLAANQARIESQIEAANKEAIESGELQPPAEDPDGAASVQPMHQPPAEPKPDALPADLAADPLSEYIVMQDGKPMFSTKVNGQLRLIPLEDARRELQIGTAAAIRMNEATRLHQQVTERAAAVSANEAALAQRVAAAPAQPAVPASDLSEDDLLDEAKEIFQTAFTGTEEDAAKKLAKTLIKLRGSVTPVAQVQPRVDEGAIVRKAAQAAVGAIQSVEKTKDVRSGYVKFQEDYPDIMGDPVLYKMADDMTDDIEKENPEWPISQVMDEAGKRTRAWVNKLKGVEPDPQDPQPQPGSQNIGEPSQPPTQTHRQDRKSELVRMPQVAAAAVHEQPAEDLDTEQTPQEAFAELKKSRGQPT